MPELALKPFGPRVLRRIACTDALQFYEGPVRSGKTQASILSLLYYIATHEVSIGIMTGDTVGSITRNVIKSKMGLIDLCPGARGPIYRDNSTQVIIPTDHGDVTIYVFGGGKANSDDQLRGVTADFWYADEITKHHPTFVAEAMARLAAAEHPFMLWTSNPDNPRHWLYTKYTDKYLAMSDEEKAIFGGYHEFHFRLEDNPIMTPAKIEALKLRYTGFEYDRKILGRRCIAEGQVYPFFDDSCIRLPPDDVKVKYAGIDFGTVHPTAMGWYGRSPSTRAWYKVREWVATPEQSQSMTTSDYLDIFERITAELGGIPRMNLTIDYGGGGEALAREAEKRRWMPVNPDKSVLDGISVTGRLLKSHRLYISPECSKTIESLRIYRWDEKASERGETKPIKQDDDPADETRYVCTTFIDPRVKP